MVKKVLCFLLFFQSTVCLPAQHLFERVIGGPGSDVAVAIFNGGTKYYLAGTTTSGGAGSYDACLIQTDTFGNVLSATSAGNFGEDVVISAAMTKQRDIIMAGYTNSFGTEHPLIMKFDQYGAFVWGKVLNVSGWAQGLTVDSSGSFFVTGYASLTNLDVFLAKYDSSGTLQWAMSCGDSLLNEGRAVLLSKDGGVLVSGTTHVHAGGPSDSFVFKTDSLGNLLWSYSYSVSGFYNWDLGYALTELGNDIVIGGLSYTGAFNPNPNSPDALVVILDSLGTVKKGLAIGSAEYEDLRKLIVQDDATICLTGAGNLQTNGNTDILFMCIDTMGNILQQRQFGGSTFDHGLCLAPLSNERMLISGYSESFGSGLEDIYFIKNHESILTCNAGNPSVSVLPIQIKQKEVFDANALSIGILSPSFVSQSIFFTEQTLCTITSVSENKPAATLEFYPNPFSHEINIALPKDSEKIISVSLVDMSGKALLKVSNPSLTNEFLTLQTNSVAAGLYLLVIEYSSHLSSYRLVHK